jgi:hypothetical protein
MSNHSSQLTEFGLMSTGLDAVDRKITEIVADSQTGFSTDMRVMQILGRDMCLGTTEYVRGTDPFVQRVSATNRGSIEELGIAQEVTPELPIGFKEKAAHLEESTFHRVPSETFPVITGWEIIMTWGYFNLGSYRAQRVKALYDGGKQRSLDDMRDEFREDPIVVISPIILSEYRADGAPYISEMFELFGRFNKGDIIPASVDFEAYPYMCARSFEDKKLMQSLIDELVIAKE